MSKPLEDEKLRTVRDDFIERVSSIAQEEGFSRIAGRIFGYLLYEGGDHSFAELAEELEVSRGSISTNVRILTERGVIERVGKPGDRQLWYRAGTDAHAAVLLNASRRAARARRSIEKTIREMPRGPQRKRIKAYAAFYGAVEQGLLRMMDDIRED